MGRYTEAKCRLCRRVGDKLMLKGERCYTAKCAMERRNVIPGYNATSKRRPKKSERGIQLLQKQRARRTYGILERQFRKMFGEAERLPGVTGDHLVILLERRLDNVAFRLGFADSRSQSRQIISHGHVTVNGRRMTIPSYVVKAGDVIGWREESRKTEYYKTLVEKIADKIVPAWLNLDTGTMVGKVVNLPSRDDIEVKFETKAIVEYYSR
ncbi:MAG: 30S ribosomal protein S4 [Dehalococcoidales bacterium]|nr:30S ribosomal protein S4 [Dehalococcoidales bacterium]